MASKKVKKEEKKILIILYYYYPYISGLSEYARSIAESIVKNTNYEIDVVCSNHEKTLSSEEFLNGVRVLRKKVLFSLSKWVFAPELFSYLIFNQKTYDKVFVFMPFTEAIILPLLVDNRKINAFYVCDMNLGQSVIDRSLNRVLLISQKILLRRASKIVPLSNDYFHHSKVFESKYAEKTFPLNPTYEILKDAGIDFRSKYKISKDTFVIGFLGRIVYEKGIDYLIKTIPFLEKKGLSDFVILIGGDYMNVRGGSIYPKLKGLIDKYPNRTIFTGKIAENEKQNFYKSMDVFVLPSIDPLEAFGIVQLEAMSVGIPVVASNLPGVREIVQNTGFGYLAKVRSSVDLAEKLYDVYKYKEELQVNKSNYLKYYSKDAWESQVITIIQ